jgi:molecular chaperone GrpE (heat shock protein)
MLQSSNRYASTAVVLQPFVPIYDQLQATREAYGDSDFGQKYNALPGAMRSAWSALGVTEMSVKENDRFDAMRMVALESVHDETAPAQTVMQVLKQGLELQGNVIRLAECVVSLGPTPPPEEETPAEGDTGSSDATEHASS